MPQITVEISLAVITVVRGNKIVSSVAVIGDADETTFAPPHARKPVFDRAVEIVQVNLGLKKVSAKMQRKIHSGFVRVGDTTIFITWPKIDLSGASLVVRE